MKNILLFLCTVCTLAACTNKGNKSATRDMNADFDRYKTSFVDALWKVYPTWASSQGYHKYDSVLVVPDDAARARELAFARANLDSLRRFTLDDLNDNSQTDYHMIENQLAGTVWSITEMKSYQWDPSG